MASTASWNGMGSKAASTAACRTACLSGKTRKIVPSAMSAASAICRVLIASPCSSSSGTVAATMAARRSSGGSAAARLRISERVPSDDGAAVFTGATLH